MTDGLLYNESDLSLEEHYTDTHAYTEINFAAFAMLDTGYGVEFSQNIKGRCALEPAIGNLNFHQLFALLRCLK